MEKVEVKYSFKYSEIWDEDTELMENKPSLIEGNKDGRYSFVIFPPEEKAIKNHAKYTLNKLVSEDKIDYYRINSIIQHRPNGLKVTIPLEQF